MRAVFIEQGMGSEIKHLFAYVQFGASFIPILSCLCIFKKPGLNVLASSLLDSIPGVIPAWSQTGCKANVIALGSRPEEPVLTWRPVNVN